jgi:hypothetical protein
MARRSRENLLDDEIMQELYPDRLSDVPSDCESHTNSNGDDDDDDFGPSASQKGRKMTRLEVTDSDKNNDVGGDVDDGWTKNDGLRNLEQSFGNTGLTFTPDYPTSISGVANRFLGNNFLEILVEQ